MPGQDKIARVEHLIGPGSDVLGDITFGGISYRHALNEGKPVQQYSSEETRIKNGLLITAVPDSSAVLLYDLLHLGCAGDRISDSPYIGTIEI